MPLYEHVFLARQDISQAQVEALVKEYSDVITEAGGKVGKTEYWGLKTVAFKIKKNRKAHYSLMNLDAPSAAIAEMERRMGLSPDVIRFITIRVDEHETEPSIQMRKSARQGSRPAPSVSALSGPLGLSVQLTLLRAQKGLCAGTDIAREVKAFPCLSTSTCS